MVVRFLSEDNGNFYDAVVFRSPPHVGASVRATFYRQTPSCNAETFKDWLGRSNREPRFKIVRSCMAKRNARKMLSTYVRPRAEQRSSDNLNHPDFNVVGAITGRLSSGMHTVPWTGALKSMVASKKRIQGQCDWRKSKLLTRLYEKSLDDLQNAEDEKAYKDAQKKIILVERCNQGIIVVGDMAQIEIRVGASFSRDAALLQIFNDALLNPDIPSDWAQIEARYNPGPVPTGEFHPTTRQPVMREPTRTDIFMYWKAATDIHRAVAASALSMSIMDVTEALRRWAKMIHFGIFYLRSALTTAEQLFKPGETDLCKKCKGARIERDGRMVNFDCAACHSTGIDSEAFDRLVEQCQDFIDGYYKRFPGVKRWQERMQQRARETREIEMPEGRVIPLASDTSDWNMRVWPVNYPVQGSAADLMNRALILMARAFRGDKWALSEIFAIAEYLQSEELFAAARYIYDHGELYSHPIASIHDSCLIDSCPEEVDYVLPIQQAAMEDRRHYDWMICPVKSDSSLGPDWGMQHNSEEKFIKKGARIDRAGNVMTD
jgi:DNA polymerase I-like protein with 3'-5' exonuclease and polymerase domains